MKHSGTDISSSSPGPPGYRIYASHGRKKLVLPARSIPQTFRSTNILIDFRNCSVNTVKIWNKM